MSADRLRAIREAATPGSWLPLRDGEVVCVCTDDGEAEVVPFNEGVAQVREADARLIALAPDLAEWAADAMDALEKARTYVVVDALQLPGPMETEADARHIRELLARLAELVPADEDTT